MAAIQVIARFMLVCLPLSVLLAACGSHGENSSPNYHINNMQRMDKNAGNEKMRRMEKEIYRDK